MHRRLYLLLEASRLDKLKQERVRRRGLRDASNPLDIPETIFMGLYRINQNMFLYLTESLRPRIPPAQRSTAIPLELKVLTTLAFLATGSYQRAAKNNLDASMCQKSISNIIKQIVGGLEGLFHDFVVFPNSPQELQKCKEGFYQKFSMPGVIGCIDGTHVRIVRPKEREELYFNRKGYHSMNVTVICDSNNCIIGVNAKFGGASHDSHVYKSMAIYPYLANMRRTQAFWLLGDSAYPLETWLMTPILNAADGSPEAKYNKVHARARNCVERTIGVLKNRWRCLLHTALHYTPAKCVQLINACVVLHNMCINARLPDINFNELPPDPLDLSTGREEDDNRRGQEVRQSLVRRLSNE